ncbi:MAG: hypothetical protein M3304_11000 [Actinomycetota bacterium]|nr:hypothetical protein [Actinomycetota bacterium]
MIGRLLIALGRPFTDAPIGSMRRKFERTLWRESSPICPAISTPVGRRRPRRT